jgi:hypothetical protein
MSRKLTEGAIAERIARIGDQFAVSGDFLYGERSELIDRHALHAARMTFSHPEDGRSITVSAPLPDDFTALCEKLIWSSDDE